jgi:hypothetical protein
MAGVAARWLLDYRAADLSLEGAFLAGLIAGHQWNAEREREHQTIDPTPTFEDEDVTESSVTRQHRRQHGHERQLGEQRQQELLRRQDPFLEHTGILNAQCPKPNAQSPKPKAQSPKPKAQGFRPNQLV